MGWPSRFSVGRCAGSANLTPTLTGAASRPFTTPIQARIDHRLSAARVPRCGRAPGHRCSAAVVLFTTNARAKAWELASGVWRLSFIPSIHGDQYGPPRYKRSDTGVGLDTADRRGV